jgi:linoleate 10R-lipoxygenase
MAKMDPTSDLVKKLNDGVISTLYNTVPHPTASYLGSTSFRQADGGGNNLSNPDVGRAGTPYSRSVQGRAGLPRSSLPDPGLIFDTVLKRKGVSISFPLQYEVERN